MVPFIYHSPTDLVNVSEPIDLHYQKRQRIAQQSYFPCFHSHVYLFHFFSLFQKGVGNNCAIHSHEFNVKFQLQPFIIRPQEHNQMSRYIEMAISIAHFFLILRCRNAMILASALELSSNRESYVRDT